MHWKGFGRKRCWPNRATTLEFAWKYWGKPQQSSVKITSTPSANRAENLKNTSVKCYRFTNRIDRGSSTVSVLPPQLFADTSLFKLYTKEKNQCFNFWEAQKNANFQIRTISYNKVRPNTEIYMTISSGGKSKGSLCGGPCSILGQVIWDLWWTTSSGAGLLRVLLLPLPLLILPTAPHSSSSIIRRWYDRPNSGRRTKWTQSHPNPRN
jgi:hypothetical protein